MEVERAEFAMQSDFNPYAAPQTDPQTQIALPEELKISRGAKRRRAALGCAAALMVASPVAAGLAMFDIESIVISGAVFMAIALVLLGLSGRKDLRLMLPIAIAMITMVIGCFSTIYLNHWSPRDAEVPIGRATVAFACLIQLGWFFFRQRMGGWSGAPD